VNKEKGEEEEEKEKKKDGWLVGYCFTPTDTEAYWGRLVTLY
jgi:hypothetical protein